MQHTQSTTVRTNNLTDQLAQARLWLSEPVDIAWLVFFRISFGLIMVWEVFRYFNHNRVYRYYMEPDFYFTYIGFGWVAPWPGDGMNIHFVVLGMLGFFIAIGFFYRLSASLFFLAFTYVFLLDKTQYLNHFYLIVLLSFIMIFLPAADAFSADVKLKRLPAQNTTPRWVRFWLLAQLSIVYIYGGIAKINGDWLRGSPLDLWLPARGDHPFLGPILSHEAAPLLFSYGGLFLDLFIVPFLFWKKTRMLAFLIGLSFHLLNATIFSIGIFPWFMIAATALFFDPDWPRRYFTFNRSNKKKKPKRKKKQKQEFQLVSPLLMSLIAVYLVIQLTVPFRHFLYPGNVSWTEEGHRFAWHMKLRDKDADADFYVLADGQSIEVDLDEYLTSRQIRKMSTRPDMIVQFAQYLEELYTDAGVENIEVRAEVKASLNGRVESDLIDPNVNLLTIGKADEPSQWILPYRDQY